MPRPKKNTCTSNNCPLHTFRLKPISKNAYYRKTLKTKFCPTYDSQTKKCKNNLFYFNSDKKPYTNAFITQSDEEMFQSRDSEIKETHEKNLDAYLVSSQNKHMYVPRPAIKRRKYCHNCRCNYEDYLQHVGSVNHKINLQKNKYFAQIRQTGRESLRKREQLIKSMTNKGGQQQKSESTQVYIKKVPITILISHDEAPLQQGNLNSKKIQESKSMEKHQGEEEEEN